MQLNTRKTNSPNKKQVGDLNRRSSSKDTQMANNYMKICTSSLIIREMQIKIIMRYHITPVRMAIIKNLQIKLEREPTTLLIGM